MSTMCGSLPTFLSLHLPPLSLMQRTLYPHITYAEFVERMNEEEGAEGQEAQPSTVPQDFSTSSFQSTLAQDTVYFCDGVRRIDFILAFDDEAHSQDAINNQKKRTEYQASLMKMGLDLEIERKEESVSGRTTFVKVHAPWNPLTTYAEILHIQARF
ncbi:anoctamin-5-like [Petromyzon marinus]|uniref:anoctamin-5-like n=1 Tax=Petromyzon marinus TaxID=7757 RepID=UPI003F7114FC